MAVDFIFLAIGLGVIGGIVLSGALFEVFGLRPDCPCDCNKSYKTGYLIGQSDLSRLWAKEFLHEKFGECFVITPERSYIDYNKSGCERFYQIANGREPTPQGAK
jgi:hypothetical protein